MNEIKCPHCGEVFKVDASGYADIVKQVRDTEFSHDLDERVKAVQREGERALELERSRSAAALQKAESQRNAQIVEQKNAAAQQLAQEVAKRDAELAELRAKLAETERALENEKKTAESSLAQAKMQAELDTERAVIAKEREMQAQLREADKENARLSALLEQVQKA